MSLPDSVKVLVTRYEEAEDRYNRANEQLFKARAQLEAVMKDEGCDTFRHNFNYYMLEHGERLRSFNTFQARCYHARKRAEER